VKIVIAGLGVMGGSLALAIRQNIPQVQIWGYDKPKVIKQALARGIIQQSVSAWPQQCARADIIFLATPMGQIKKQLSELNGHINRQTVVSDVGSTKHELADWVKKIEFSGSYIGGHPMTGAEKSGLQAANPLLYENAVYLLCDVTPEKQALLKNKLQPVLEAIKARVLLIDSAAHDEILAAISHLPQLLAIELVNLVGAKNDAENPYLMLAAGGFRDLTRIASSSIEIWQDIINSNKKNIRNTLKDFIRRLEKDSEKLDDLHQEFESANAFRRQVPKETKGFLSPLTDILVYVTDQVGVVARIANALSEHRIDIRDMELLKIREKEGGVFRLSFSSLTEAKTAVRILQGIGYQAFLRE